MHIQCVHLPVCVWEREGERYSIYLFCCLLSLGAKSATATGMYISFTSSLIGLSDVRMLAIMGRYSKWDVSLGVAGLMMQLLRFVFCIRISWSLKHCSNLEPDYPVVPVQVGWYQNSFCTFAMFIYLLAVVSIEFGKQLWDLGNVCSNRVMMTINIRRTSRKFFKKAAPNIPGSTPISLTRPIKSLYRRSCIFYFFWKW